MKLSVATTTGHDHKALTLAISLRRWLAIFIVAASFNLSLPLVPGVFTAAGKNSSTSSGIIRVRGTVMIDGLAVRSGQTIFSGSQITTAEGAESIIDLGKLTRLRLLPETDFSLDFSPTRISSTLRAGMLRGFIPAGLPANFHAAGGELVTDPSQATEFTVQVTGEDIHVQVKTGRVELRTENELKAIGAGEVFATSGGPQDSQDDDDEGLSTEAKVGILAAIGGAAALLLIAFRGRDESQPEFGGCVIVPSGPTSGICP
ncbi:MAG TPA: hypothetical protein VNO50_16070 [Pyrinomonadaceae bacterium]|nr:hypothetical protein [Pyrinomonadaceae bacterium]